jgi:hypothetical protein
MQTRLIVIRALKSAVVYSNYGTHKNAVGGGDIYSGFYLNVNFSN